jgi:hypothetical protein
MARGDRVSPKMLVVFMGRSRILGCRMRDLLRSQWQSLRIPEQPEQGVNKWNRSEKNLSSDGGGPSQSQDAGSFHGSQPNPGMQNAMIASAYYPPCDHPCVSGTCLYTERS